MRALKYTTFVALITLVLALAPAAAAQPPRVSGAYLTEAAQGTVAFTAERLVRPGYYIGWFTVDGTEYLGSYSAVPGAGYVALSWTYDFFPDYPTAGEMLVVYYPEERYYFGVIFFFDPDGAMIDVGYVYLQ